MKKSEKSKSNLHLEKKGIRGLGIAECFTSNMTKSILAGVVMRNDLIFDDFVFGNTTLFGDDATSEILNMYEQLDRSDINYILISGIIISMYNIINIKAIHDSLHIPIIAITYQQSLPYYSNYLHLPYSDHLTFSSKQKQHRDSQKIYDAIKHHFRGSSHHAKLDKLINLQKREKICLKTSHNVFVLRAGCTIFECKRLLDKITLQGSRPEPIRIAQLLAKKILLYSK